MVIVGAWAMFGTFVKAANSIEKLEDGLYAMQFTGDYGFDEFLAAGGAVTVFRNIAFLGASNKLNQFIVALFVVIKQVIAIFIYK